MRDLQELVISTGWEMVLEEINRIERLLEELLAPDPLPLSAQPFNIHELLETVIWFEETEAIGDCY